MAKFVFLYKGGVMGETPEEQDAVINAWMGWFGSSGESVLNHANPFGESLSTRTVLAARPPERCRATPFLKPVIWTTRPGWLPVARSSPAPGRWPSTKRCQCRLIVRLIDAPRAFETETLPGSTELAKRATIN